MYVSSSPSLYVIRTTCQLGSIKLVGLGCIFMKEHARGWALITIAAPIEPLIASATVYYLSMFLSTATSLIKKPFNYKTDRKQLSKWKVIVCNKIANSIITSKINFQPSLSQNFPANPTFEQSTPHTFVTCQFTDPPTREKDEPNASSSTNNESNRKCSNNNQNGL